MILLRHDRVRASGLCYGWSDPALQRPIAETVADLDLPDWRRLVSSPSPRCLRLARALAGRQPVRICPNLKELHFGDWEGKRWDDIARSDLDRWAEQPLTFRLPGGESAGDLFCRVSRWAARFQPGSGDLIIAHAGSLRALAAYRLGTDFDTTWQWPLPYATPVTVTIASEGFVPYEAQFR